MSISTILTAPYGGRGIDPAEDTERVLHYRINERVDIVAEASIRQRILKVTFHAELPG